MITEKKEREVFDKRCDILKEKEMLHIDFNKKSYDYR